MPSGAHTKECATYLASNITASEGGFVHSASSQSAKSHIATTHTSNKASVLKKKNNTNYTIVMIDALHIFVASFLEMGSVMLAYVTKQLFPPPTAPAAITTTTTTTTTPELSKMAHLPVETLSNLATFLQDGKVDSLFCALNPAERGRFISGYCCGNIAVLEHIVGLCVNPLNRKEGKAKLKIWTKKNKDLIFQYATALIDGPLPDIRTMSDDGQTSFDGMAVFRNPLIALWMDDPDLLEEVVTGSNGSPALDIHGHNLSSNLYSPEGTVVTNSMGILDFLMYSYSIMSIQCFKWLLGQVNVSVLLNRTHASHCPSVVAKYILSHFCSKSSPINNLEVEVMTLFLCHPICRLNAPNRNGLVPLHFVLIRLKNIQPSGFSQHQLQRCIAAVSMLVKAGADIERAGPGLMTPHKTALQGAKSDTSAVAAQNILALEVMRGCSDLNNHFSGVATASNIISKLLSMWLGVFVPLVLVVHRSFHSPTKGSLFHCGSYVLVWCLLSSLSRLLVSLCVTTFGSSWAVAQAADLLWLHSLTCVTCTLLSGCTFAVDYFWTITQTTKLVRVLIVACVVCVFVGSCAFVVNCSWAVAWTKNLILLMITSACPFIGFAEFLIIKNGGGRSWRSCGRVCAFAVLLWCLWIIDHKRHRLHVV